MIPQARELEPMSKQGHGGDGLQQPKKSIGPNYHGGGNLQQTLTKKDGPLAIRHYGGIDIRNRKSVCHRSPGAGLMHTSPHVLTTFFFWFGEGVTLRFRERFPDYMMIPWFDAELIKCCLG